MKYRVVLTITDDPKISTCKAGDVVYRSNSKILATKRAAKWARLGAIVEDAQ